MLKMFLSSRKDKMSVSDILMLPKSPKIKWTVLLTEMLTDWRAECLCRVHV